MEPDGGIPLVQLEIVALLLGNSNASDQWVEMIDLHCHILPGMDDGAASMEASIEMLRLTAESGITDIAATPHANLRYAFEPAAVTAAVARPMIVHPAPLLGFPEPLQMAASVDAVVVVALAGQTHRKSLGLTVNTLKRLRANVVGVVLNEIKPVSENSYYHYSPKSYRHYR